MLIETMRQRPRNGALGFGFFLAIVFHHDSEKAATPRKGSLLSTVPAPDLPSSRYGGPSLESPSRSSPVVVQAFARIMGGEPRSPSQGPSWPRRDSRRQRPRR